MEVRAADGTTLVLKDVETRQAAERTYLLRFVDPEYGRLSAVISTICLDNPDRLQDAKGYLAQHVLGVDSGIRFSYNSYPRIDALYDIVSRCEKSRKVG